MLVMGASIGFLILALEAMLRACASNRRDLRVVRPIRHRERQPHFRRARAFALGHQQPQQTKMRLQPAIVDNARMPQGNLAQI